MAIDNSKQLKERIKSLLNWLNQGLYERELIVNLSFLAMMSNEPVFLLGPPGVAKSLIARRLSSIIEGGRVFEYLMHRFSTPDEIFGPISINKLKTEDKYERVIKGYLPDAEVVFLDEIWKAGASIQNTLLTVINERLFKNGDHEIKVPLLGLIAASNELPSQNQNLEALYDRLLMRLVVENIEDDDSFLNMIVDPNVRIKADKNDVHLLTKQDLEYISKSINNIEVSKEVLDVILVIKKKLIDYNLKLEDKSKSIIVSDRRWKKVVKILRTSALLNNRNRVNLSDIFIIPYCIWNELANLNIVQEVVKIAISDFSIDYSADFHLIQEEISKLKEDVNRITHIEELAEANVLKIIKHNEEEYCKFAPFKFGSYRSVLAMFIKLSDYKSLEDESSINLYDSEFEGHTLIVHKSEDNHSICITLNEDCDRKLETIKKEYKIIKANVPKDYQVKDWDSRVKSIYEDISSQERILKDLYDETLKDYDNFFIDISTKEYILMSFNETKEEIDAIKLDLTKFQRYYKNLKQDEILKDDKPINAVD